MDKGPWRATSLYVGSDDFTHDVSLEINGDFGEGERDKYAEWLAKELNDCSRLRFEYALARAEKVERELEDEKQKVKNLEEYMLKGVAFRDELKAARDTLAGQLCRAREALEKVRYAHELGGSVTVRYASPVTREQQWHQAKAIAIDAVLSALSSTASCPHEEETKQMREAVEWALGGEGSDFRPRAEGEGPYWWRAELRRRADAGREG